jgi:hypothetical protein
MKKRGKIIKNTGVENIYKILAASEIQADGKILAVSEN